MGMLLLLLMMVVVLMVITMVLRLFRRRHSIGVLRMGSNLRRSLLVTWRTDVTIGVVLRLGMLRQRLLRELLRRGRVSRDDLIRLPPPFVQHPTTCSTNPNVRIGSH